jgi:hypothetical protein
LVILGTIPHAGTSTVHTGLPIGVSFAVTLAAKLRRLFKFNLLATTEVEHVKVGGIVAIDAPHFAAAMVEFDHVVRIT